MTRIERIYTGYKKLEREFYLRNTIKVAKDLLGKYLIRKLGRKHLVGKIVEVEAYLHNDPASHSYRGKTKRNEVMFRQGGHLYVYFTYGMHFCCNVVTEDEGKGCAVLIRAVEPMENIELMKTHRKIGTTKNIFNLTNGPAKLCQAFGLSRNENGTDLCGEQIWIGEINISKNLNLSAHTRSESMGQAGQKSKISSSSRIGITNGYEHQWRFYFKENRWVSKK